MKPDPHKPTYDYAQYDIDFNEMSHKDILDIVYQRRAPKNADEIEAFEQMEEDFKMAAPEAIRYYYDLGNRKIAQEEESLEMYLPMLADFIDPQKFTYLPNTAGCFTGEDAVRTLRLAREAGGWSLVKLEVLGDEKTLLQLAHQLEMAHPWSPVCRSV